MVNIRDIMISQRPTIEQEAQLNTDMEEEIVEQQLKI